MDRALSRLIAILGLNVLGHLAFVGARMTTSLYALHLGASPFTVGVLLALFAALPMLLSVTAGRLIDRIGPSRPLLVAFAVMTLAVLLPFLFPSVQALYASSTLLGVGFMFVHIGMNSVIGAHGGPEQRAMNFAWLAIGFSVSGSTGPLVAGFAIETLGHARAFLLLAAFPALALVLLCLRREPLPRPERHPAAAAERRLLDLFHVAGLRHAFIVSGMLATGWDLYSFLMPVYGASIGLAPATIGTIMATFSIATFVVRLAMPALMRRARQWMIIGGAMVVAGLGYLLFPLVSGPALLMAISFVLGLGLGCAQPVIMALLYDASPPGRQSEAVGVRTTMINASQTVVPLFSGAISAALGMMPVFWLLAGSLFWGAWFARRQAQSRARP
jgi:MFS family permease